jgi:hypothetical protein
MTLWPTSRMAMTGVAMTGARSKSSVARLCYGVLTLPASKDRLRNELFLTSCLNRLAYQSIGVIYGDIGTR